MPAGAGRGPALHSEWAVGPMLGHATTVLRDGRIVEERPLPIITSAKQAGLEGTRTEVGGNNGGGTNGPTEQSMMSQELQQGWDVVTSDERDEGQVERHDPDQRGDSPRIVRPAAACRGPGRAAGALGRDRRPYWLGRHDRRQLRSRSRAQPRMQKRDRA